MPELNLRYLSLSDKKSFYKALNSAWEPNFPFLHYWQSLAKENFEDYVNLLPGFAQGISIPIEHVPASFLFAYNRNNEIIGRVSIRHRLNEHLLKEGGHIGYGVVPGYRRQGYATEILKESLDYIRNYIPEIGAKVLLTCDQTNLGSRKTIERNGGVLENIILSDKGVEKMRYWIQL